VTLACARSLPALATDFLRLQSSLMQDDSVHDTGGRSVRSPRWFVVAVVLMLIAFGVVVWQRNVIRAHWWATRLAAIEDLGAPDAAAWRSYLAAIADIGSEGAGAARRLARHERPHIRLLAVHLLGRLAPAQGVENLARLLRDSDRGVREAAALALAFCGAPPCSDALIVASRDASGDVAAAALSGLARCSDDASWAAICTAARQHASPLARAQAAEAILQRLHGGPESAVGALNARPCAPFEVLVALLADEACFEGRLALEREIDRVSAAVARRPEAGLRSVLHVTSRPTMRAVAEIAADGLSQLTGRAIAAESVPPAEVAGWVAALRQAWEDHRAAQTRPRVPDVTRLPQLDDGASGARHFTGN